MHELLITLAADFSNDDWFGSIADRLVSTMLLGKAGDLRHGRATGAWLAARKMRPGSLGHRPAERKFSPRRNEDGGYTLLAGRIFEARELSAELGIAEPLDHADLYAAAHARYGENVDSRIIGNYASIRWFPDTRRLRLARSPISSHPLHVWRDGPRLVASSIPRAIFAAGVEARVNDTKLADSLLLNVMDGSDSWYEGLARVASGSVAVHDPGGSSVREYWSIDKVPEVRFAKDQDYVEALDEQFRRAIRAELEGARKPALMLSGGLDSQAVASYAVDELGPDRKLRSFTFVPMPGWEPSDHKLFHGDESGHVKALVGMYPQIEPVFLDSAAYRFGDKIDSMFLLGSWPTTNEMTMHNMHDVSEAATADGCDVLLHGAYGNISFSYAGMTGFPTWLRGRDWRRLMREVACNSDHPGPYWRKFFKLAVRPNLPAALLHIRDRNNPHVLKPFESWCPMRKDFAEADGTVQRARAVDSDPASHQFANSGQWRNLVHRTLANNAPEIWLGQQLLHGVEPRDPTSFLPLVELCAGIPDEQYLRDGESRWLARRLLKGRVPEMVRTERRKGQAAADWPLRFARDREDMLADMESLKRDARLSRIFDFDRMIHDLRNWQGRDDADSDDLHKVYVAIGRGVSTARFVRYAEGRNAG